MNLKKWTAVILTLLVALGMLPAGSLAATLTGQESASGLFVVADPCAEGHSWGNWQTTKQGNCITQGEESRSCSRCGKTETRSTGYSSHNWRNYWVTVTEPTCAAEGVKERECQHCGKKETKLLEKLPHSWDEWSILVQASESVPGLLVRTCQVCGEQETKDYDLDSETLPDDLNTVYSGGPSVPDSGLPDQGKGLAVTITVVGGDDQVFNLYDDITYEITVTNLTDEPLDNVEISDQVNIMGFFNVLATESIAAHGSVTKTSSYAVTIPDVVRGHVLNRGIARDSTKAASDESSYIGESETIKTTIAPYADFQEDLQITVEVTSGKTSGYQLDETITYLATVYNPKSFDIAVVTLGTFFNDVLPGSELGSSDGIAAKKSRTESFSHTVDDTDIKRGYVTCKVDANGSLCTKGQSEPVVVYTGDTVPEDPDPNPDGNPLPDKDPDPGTSQDPRVPDVTGKPREATCWKDVSGGPPNGKYYRENETVFFEIHIENHTGMPITNVTVCDALSANAGQVVAKYSMIPADGSEIAPFDYIVDDLDVGIGSVTNMGTVTYRDSYGDVHSVIVGPVTVYAGAGDSDDPGRELPKASDTIDCCERVLLGLGEGAAEYRQYFCSTHSPIAGQIKTRLEKAETDEDRLNVWQSAVSDWTSALNLEYDQLLDQASEAEKPVFEAERTAFGALVDAARNEWAALYPDNPALVEEKLAGLLMSRCTELCYELHAAPAQRLDSRLSSWFKELDSPEPDAECTREVTPKENSLIYRENLCARHRLAEATVEAVVHSADTPEVLADAWLNARYLWTAEQDVLIKALRASAGREAIAVISAERAAFTAWLASWESELALLYPDHPEVFHEILAQTMVERVLDLCNNPLCP